MERDGRYCGRVGVGLAGAFAASLCYGLGSIFQSVAARKVAPAQGLDLRLLWRLARSWQYVLGVALDAVGFVLALAAVRTLPLFVVQAILASFLAVTAIVGAFVFGTRLSLVDRVGLAVVIGGLALVALSAAEERAATVSTAQQWGVLAATLILAAVAGLLATGDGPSGAAILGAVAGLAFGITSIAARTLPGSFAPDQLKGQIGTLLAAPATYALILAGVLGMLTYAMALQRGTVTQATALLVVGETVVPAVVGVLMLGDAPRAGWDAWAVLGFGLAVAGAVSLSRPGEENTDL